MDFRGFDPPITLPNLSLYGELQRRDRTRGWLYTIVQRLSIVVGVLWGFCSVDLALLLADPRSFPLDTSLPSFMRGMWTPAKLSDGMLYSLNVTLTVLKIDPLNSSVHLPLRRRLALVPEHFDQQTQQHSPQLPPVCQG